MINKSEKFLIKGGKPLNGKIKISGAKNAASKQIISSLLTDQPVKISNCPIGISEIITTREICETIGSKFTKFSDNEVIVQTKTIKDFSFSAELGQVNRLSILTIGPLFIHNKII